jgi:hypothetical protein
VRRVALLFVAGLAIAGAIPFAARPLRRDAAERCALDGVEVDARHAVRIVDTATGASHRFCCVPCAATWLSREPQADRRVLVVDEETGAELAAEDAFFVRSLVTAVAATSSRVHVFATESAARRHAEEFHGTLLAGDDHPLRPAR